MLAAGKDPGDPKQNKKKRHRGAEAPTAARPMAARGQLGFENPLTPRRIGASVAGEF